MSETLYRLRQFDAASGATTNVTENLPNIRGKKAYLQSADLGCASLSAGPFYAALSYGDTLTLSFTLLASGTVRSDANFRGSDRLSWTGHLEIDANLATPAISVIVRNDTGATVTAVALSYEVVLE